MKADIKHIHSSESVEWFTPSVYVEAAREVLGSIDLDPASCIEANKVVKAKKIYTITDDGLSKFWSGKVFLNPPYGKIAGKSQQEVWSRKLTHEFLWGDVTEAILLVNAAIGDKWFQPLWDRDLCFPDRRIKFTGQGTTPTKGNCFAYFGERPERFKKVFCNFGKVVLRSPTPSEPEVG